MEKDYIKYNLAELKNLYQLENENLQKELLSGADWNKVIPQRKKITAISIALYHKLKEAGSLSPAEFSVRGKARNAGQSPEPE